MNLMKIFAHWITLSGVITTVTASCEPPLAFRPPTYSNESLAGVFTNISTTLNKYFSNSTFDATNIAIEVTSSQQALWSFFWAATNKSSQAGATVVDGSTVFRVTRSTKIFTTLAILQLNAQGRIADLDYSIASYVPGLKQDGNEPQAVDWSRISLRDLLNEMGGIIDMYAYADILTSVSASSLAAFGLPPVTNSTLASVPACELNLSEPCTASDLLSALQSSLPVLRPNVEDSNSNVGFSLLGLAIANVTGLSYEESIRQSIILPLGLNSTSFIAPNIGSGAVPKGNSLWSWDVGINNPSVGIYTSSRDMSVFLRWILANYLDIHPTINWFTPGFYGVGSHNYIGMPWNIFRTTAVLPQTNRPVTFNTVVGTLGSYTAVSIVLPDYDLAISLMMSGALGDPNLILEYITFPLVHQAEEIAQNNLKSIYAGTYSSSSIQSELNTSVTLSQSSARSLFLGSWISNGTAILPSLVAFTAMRGGQGADWYFQLAPTFTTPLRRERPGNRTQLGEAWRWVNILEAPADQGWNDWCVSSFDGESYAGTPINKMIFWRDGSSGEVDELEIPAFNVTLAKMTSS